MASFRGFIETALYNAFIISTLASANNGGLQFSHHKKRTFVIKKKRNNYNEEVPKCCKIIIFLSLTELELICAEISPSVLTAVADLLHAGEVESVDVPLSLQRLGAALSKSAERDRFIKMTPEEALEWLQKSDSPEAKRYAYFMHSLGTQILILNSPKVKLYQNLTANDAPFFSIILVSASSSKNMDIDV